MTTYNAALTDDEWREANFTYDVLCSATRLGQVGTPEALIAYASKYGRDGILESAIMLGQDGYRQVERALKA